MTRTTIVDGANDDGGEEGDRCLSLIMVTTVDGDDDGCRWLIDDKDDDTQIDAMMMVVDDGCR